MYGKLFASAFTGSLLGKGSDAFAVLAYLIANQDAKGFVEVNPQLVGVAIGCGTEAVERVLAFLESPDPGSRTPDEEGRRIVREGRFLFRLVNGPRYRALRDEDARREYQREWDRAHRPSGHARRLAAVRSGPTRSDAIRPMEKKRKKKRESPGESEGGARPPATPRRALSDSPPNGPSPEEWRGYARTLDSAWPLDDVDAALDAARAKGLPRRGDWRARCRGLHRAYRRRVAESRAKVTPAERERLALAETLRRSREKSARDGPANPLSRLAVAPESAGPGLGPSGRPGAPDGRQGEGPTS